MVLNDELVHMVEYHTLIFVSNNNFKILLDRCDLSVLHQLIEAFRL